MTMTHSQSLVASMKKKKKEVIVSVIYQLLQWENILQQVLTCVGGFSVLHLSFWKQVKESLLEKLVKETIVGSRGEFQCMSNVSSLFFMLACFICCANMILQLRLIPVFVNTVRFKNPVVWKREAL